MQYRNYVFTLNNYTDLEVDALSQIECRYLGYGKEVGESLTPHLQGLICFEHKKSLRQLKAMPGLARAHLEPMKGTFEQAKEYCQKEGQFTERGIPLASSKEKGEKEKERWDEIRRLAEDGLFSEIDSKVYIQHDNALHRIRNRAIQKDKRHLDGELEHEWWYGEPGTGKTSEAVGSFPMAYIKDPKERWWDGYDNEDVVIIDDFDKYQVSMAGDMKRWLDRYVFQAPVKGGYMTIRPKKVIVTSNYHPDEIWEDEVTRNAIKRRVKIRHFMPNIFKPSPISRLSNYAPNFNPPEYCPATDREYWLDKYKDIEF